MNVKVFTFEAMENILSLNVNKHDVISIRNSDKLIPEFIQKSARNYLDLLFDDIDCPFSSYIMPSKLDVEKALAFSRNKVEVFICSQGITGTRCTALKYVILCQESSVVEAKRILEHRDHPNEPIVRFGSEILGKREIYDEFMKWRPARFV